MNPEDIQQHEFFVGLRGYDREEVDAFLADIASEYRALLEELQRYRDGELTGPDPIADVGASVTAILRTANEQAEEIALQAREAADATRREAEDDVKRLREEAEQAIEQAREEAARLIEEAQAAVERIEADAEERGRERAVERADAEIGRLTEAARRHEELRARLAEAGDEISLALMAMGEPLGDAHAAVQDVVLHDTAAVNEH
jgi:DivIVA domain-containing protein